MLGQRELMQELQQLNRDKSDLEANYNAILEEYEKSVKRENELQLQVDTMLEMIHRRHKLGNMASDYVDLAEFMQRGDVNYFDYVNLSYAIAECEVREAEQ